MTDSNLTNLQGVFNFRDLGGLPTKGGGKTRSGIFYRSAALATLTEEGQSQLSNSDIGVIVDYRTIGERVAQPDRVPTSREFEVVELPISTGNMSAPEGSSIPKDMSKDMLEQMTKNLVKNLPSFNELYQHMLDEAPEDFAQTARLVAEADPAENTAVLIHCTAGKDRTGVGTALILSAVGVQRDAIVADYASSQENLKGPWADGMLNKMKEFGVPMEPQLVKIVTQTPPEAIEYVLDTVEEKYGSAAGYLKHGGLTDAELEALRSTLV